VGEEVEVHLRVGATGAVPAGVEQLVLEFGFEPIGPIAGIYRCGGVYPRLAVALLIDRLEGARVAGPSETLGLLGTRRLRAPQDGEAEVLPVVVFAVLRRHHVVAARAAVQHPPIGVGLA